MKEIEIFTQAYRPFTMGGDVWRYTKTKAKPEQVITLKGFKVGIFRNPFVEQYHACLMEGGAMIASALSDVAVVKIVSEDIESGDEKVMKDQIQLSLELNKKCKLEDAESFFSRFKGVAR